METLWSLIFLVVVIPLGIWLYRRSYSPLFRFGIWLGGWYFVSAIAFLLLYLLLSTLGIYLPEWIHWIVFIIGGVVLWTRKGFLRPVSEAFSSVDSARSDEWKSV